MDFTSMALESLKKEGEFNLGDVSFKLEDEGISLDFNKKGKLPEHLLPGISKNELEKANPPKIDIKSLVNDSIIIKNDNKDHFTLYSKGEIKNSLKVLYECCNKVRDIYDGSASHITRMFGSYILISKNNNHLKAIYATPSPIKYCPLMFKLLKEVGGEIADKLLLSLNNNEPEKYQELMLDLINDVVIAGGGFNDNRPLNSCERNVMFGASEIMADAMQNKNLDASVIVSNNLGTVITPSPNTTQGVVKRMSGLFYTTPSSNVVNTALKENILPVFPFTGKIDQIEGLKQAIVMGHKRISVSVAANDNYHLKDLSELERDDLTIYRFALCATGVNEETAEIMANNADIVWSCASKPVREIVAPKALAQVGTKIPVYIMSQRGWELVMPRIQSIDSSFDFDSIKLSKGNDMPVIFKNSLGLSLTTFKNLDMRCIDCPTPCV